MTTTTTPATPTQHNAINWFEIPVQDIDRAQAFYEAMLAAPLQRMVMGPQTLAVLPYTEPGTGGALLAGGEATAPSAQGTLVYLNAGPLLDATVARAVAAGGRLLGGRVDLPDGMGSHVLLLDLDGNRIGLHAPA